MLKEHIKHYEYSLCWCAAQPNHFVLLSLTFRNSVAASAVGGPSRRVALAWGIVARPTGLINHLLLSMCCCREVSDDVLCENSF